MTPDELDRIEFELSITLPELYRRAVDPYPIPALARNTDWMFWDDAEALIALNRRMREGKRFRDPWPARFYALGEDAGGCSEPLDLLTEVPGSSARGSRERLDGDRRLHEPLRLADWSARGARQREQQRQDQREEVHRRHHPGPGAESGCRDLV